MILLFAFFAFSFSCTNIGATIDCSNNGICAFDQRTNSTRCVCDAGFLGLICQDLCTMVGFAVECSQNGICAFDKRVNGTRCVCDIGFYGRYCNSNTTSAPTTAPTPFTTTAAPTTTAVSTTAATIAPTTTVAATTVLSPPPPIVTTLAPSTVTPQSTFSNCVDYKNYLQGQQSICSGHGTCELYPPGFPNTGYYCKCEGRYYGTYC